ncbi:hypothetical protein H4R19_005678 [Coemansia spiralis]|nr:hypothetical protein H4R19_005678 [Coemansia spiralis]
MVYDTVVVKCGTKGTDGPENVDIETMLDLVVDARCLHVVRKVMIDVRYRTSPLQGLNAVIERMRGAAGEWAGVRKLGLSLNASGTGQRELNLPAADHEDEIASVSSALAALMPGLREIKLDALKETPIVRVLFGQLAGFYADQLQVLHSSSSLVVPQDRVFARLRYVKITGPYSGPLGAKLPRLDPAVVESLVLKGPTVNNTWSMFCADSDGCAITFPRLTNLDLKYLSSDQVGPGQFSRERPWALQFPAVKHVRISCEDEECPSMENAVFPDCLESLDLTACSSMLPVFAGRNLRVSRKLALYVEYKHDASNRDIDIANRMFAESDSYNVGRLVVTGIDPIPPELITCTGLAHLHFNGVTTADYVMQFIRRQRHLLRLQIDAQILKYLLLRIPTLKSIYTHVTSNEEIQSFIDEYVQWYPHLANVEVVD